MKRVLPTMMLALLYGVGVVVSKLGKLLPIRSRKTGRIIVCVTIDNPNWFRAHVLPIVASNYGEVIVICDQPLDRVENLSYACPPPWLAKLICRAGAKFVWTIAVAVRRPADLIMGYHIFPCALISLIAARMTRTHAAYQVTSGKTEIEGGGYLGENKLFKMLGEHNRLVEERAQSLSREFDLVLVRGTSIKEYFEGFGYPNLLKTLTGAIAVENTPALDRVRETDVIFVGRLAEIKQVPVLLAALSKLDSELRPKVQIVGDGPDKEALIGEASALGLDGIAEFLGQRDDVYTLLSNAKIFVLCSRSESVSIAMLEAMSRGVVPVTTSVGDLADYVVPDETGYLVAVGDSEDLADRISSLLKNPADWQRMSLASQERVKRCSHQAVSQFWLDTLAELRGSNQRRESRDL